jgi:hypothetical protein
MKEAANWGGFTGGGMKKLSKRDWLFVALAAFVMSGTAFVILYWLYRTGW